MDDFVKEKDYGFYGWEQAVVLAITDEYEGIHTPRDAKTF